MGHTLLAYSYGKAHSRGELSCNQPRRGSSPKIQKKVHWVHVLGQRGYEPGLLPGKKHPTWNGSKVTRHPLYLALRLRSASTLDEKEREDLLDKSF